MVLPRPVSSSDVRIKSESIAVNTALAAGGDLAELGVWIAPTGLRVVRVTLLPQVASSGIDGDNASVWTLRAGVAGSTISSVTQATDFAANTAVAMTMGAEATIAQGTVITLQVANGAAADLDGITDLCIDWTSDGLVDP